MTIRDTLRAVLLFGLLVLAAPKAFPQTGARAGGGHDPSGGWWVAVETKGGRVAVDPASGARRPLPALPRGAVLSPDGSHLAYTEVWSIGAASGSELYAAAVGAPNGAARQMTSGARRPREPQWMPDGRRLVYVRGLGDGTQVYLTDTTAEKLSERRVSAGEKQSWRPRVAPDGRISYLELQERRGKEQIVNLVVVNGRERKVLVEREPLTDHAWSPDGKRIVCGAVGSVFILDVATGERTTRSLQSIDERLYAHAAQDLAWRPDGKAIAARITFVGGRALSAPDEEPEPMFGDRQVFILPVTGKATWIDMPGAVDGVGWVKAERE